LTVKLSGTVDGGNKVLAVVGNVEMYGIKRVGMTRLLNSVYETESEIIVDTTVPLDWVVGDEIFLSATATQNRHGEYRTISAITGGLITLNAPLDYYHYGDGDTTGDLNGVDARGEVILITRNILIQGEDKDGWGGQVMATDLFEMDGTWRKG